MNNVISIGETTEITSPIGLLDDMVMEPYWIMFLKVMLLSTINMIFTLVENKKKKDNNNDQLNINDVELGEDAKYQPLEEIQPKDWDRKLFEPNRYFVFLQTLILTAQFLYILFKAATFVSDPSSH